MQVIASVEKYENAGMKFSTVPAFALVGQNCRCRLVFEFSYFLYSIFHFLDILLNPYLFFHTSLEYISKVDETVMC